MDQTILITLTGIIVTGIGAQWLAWRLKVPAILFLLGIGLFLGPVTGLLDPNALLGDLLFPFVSLAVAVILFEGALTLQFKELKGVGSAVWLLVTLGAFVTWVIASYAAHYFVGLEPLMAALFGAIVIVTGPTVIVPLLRIVRPNSKVSTILRWEGIIIDPIGAVVAVLVFEYILMRATPQQADAGLTAIILPFLQLIGAGLLLGLAGGYLLGLILRRHWLPEYLINVFVLATVLAVFTLSSVLAHDSGLIAVTAMGILLANMRGVPLTDILHFKESLTILFISVLFILLAARIEPAMFSRIGFGALLVLLAIQFVAQPAKVWISTIGAGLNWREKLLTAWIGPRGIVAAAISGLFAIKLDQHGVSGAEVLVPLTFTIIFGTVVTASLTARPLANYLGVAQPEDKGVLMVGINVFSRMLAQALKKNGYRAILADSNFADIRIARMEGLETFYGNAVSQAADQRLDLVGIGRLFAVSGVPEMNNLAAIRYRHEFGAENVYVLQTPQEKSGSGQQRLSDVFTGRKLFGPEVSLGDLMLLVEQKAEIKSTRLTEEFNWEKYQQTYDNRGILLLMISPKGILHVQSDGPMPTPSEGWIIIGLYRPQTEVEAKPDGVEASAT
ncbi:MAG: sodium:proton antiporter [Halothiobacillus sp. 14-56-357]|jgi:NhaP-type Na+/H+ or K+/H+ antiporter|uniref:cation:proton antiporter n=1 Tax=Halothiobacillus sp. 15-55-196 TaxID=1970382 RepID=UPI000BD89311|nr:sodium:proton antiporter [Halothiobacillus sp. 15-55-196]OZB35855.1 MAG: sodium:proton antiporter [Halothiobacillus sp. 15-55-196]OZB55782.1 MAG: sodium:proton antiporter [Halothiobacillus sp. 14-56-357]OZB77566.1 MAG: sodium:proton antiporter [Halothiobacillus sp. 13-55-115]